MGRFISSSSVTPCLKMLAGVNNAQYRYPTVQRNVRCAKIKFSPFSEFLSRGWSNRKFFSRSCYQKIRGLENDTAVLVLFFIFYCISKLGYFFFLLFLLFPNRNPASHTKIAITIGMIQSVTATEKREIMSKPSSAFRAI